MLTPILCCDAATPWRLQYLHNNFPNEEDDNLVFRNLLTIALQSGYAEPIQDPTFNSISEPSSNTILSIMQRAPFMLNVHTSHDFGPSIAHRYFLPIFQPTQVKQPLVSLLSDTKDWVEASKMDVWIHGTQYGRVRSQMAYKCLIHHLFFLFMLKPSLTFPGAPRLQQGEWKKDTEKGIDKGGKDKTGTING